LSSKRGRENISRALFTHYDPLEMIRNEAKKLTPYKRRKVSHYIQQAALHMRRCHEFRCKMLEGSGNDFHKNKNPLDDNYLFHIFLLYFDHKIDGSPYLMAIPRDAGEDFIRFLATPAVQRDSSFSSKDTKANAKYGMSAFSYLRLIAEKYTEEITSFIKAYYFLRHAQLQIDKLLE
tara:strand:+ start:272 stop:802 length:531 start_codon:yes stop_codon:yes gene_type:complete